MGLLRVAAVPQNCTHDVHLRVAGSSVAAAFVDLLKDCRGRAKPQAAAAVLFWDQDSQESCLGQRRHELTWIGAVSVLLAPVLAREPLAERANRIPDGFDLRIGTVARLRR